VRRADEPTPWDATEPDLDGPGEPTTFAELAARWQTTQIHRPATVDLVDSQLRNHILPAFGDRDPADIRPSDVQAWVRARAQHLAPTTVDLGYRIIRSICSMAVNDGVLDATPCVDIRRPRRERPPVIPPTPEQVEAVRSELPLRYRALVTLAAGTGLRQGECLGLVRERLDFDDAVINVDRQLVTPTRGQPVIAPPKTRSSYRRVPMPDVVADALVEHMVRFLPHESGLIFTNRRGLPIRRSTISDAWRSAARRVGVHARFHDLRHFYASLLIRHGESVKVVQARLGHASATETLDTYAHLWADNGDQTRAAVDAVLGHRT